MVGWLGLRIGDFSSTKAMASIGNRESWSVSINRVTPIAGWFISWKTRK